jgi:hypothetical protein
MWKVIAPGHEPEPVVFDLMHPLEPTGGLSAGDGRQGSMKLARSAMRARVTLFQPQKRGNGNVTETPDYCFRHFFRTRSDCFLCSKPSRRVYGGAEGCLRRRCSAPVQFLHVGPSAAYRLHAEQPKQGQLTLPCGDGWWQEKESWLITRVKPRRLDRAGGSLVRRYCIVVKDEESVGASRDLLGDKYGLECPDVTQRSPPVRLGDVLRYGLERASDSLGPLQPDLRISPLARSKTTRPRRFMRELRVAAERGGGSGGG